MKKIIAVFLIFSSHAALAAPITTGNSGCAPLAHTASADVAYVPGSAAGGTPVAPAETEASALAGSDFNHADIYTGIPLSTYSSRTHASPAVQGVIDNSDIYVGQMQVRENSVTLDGRELSPANAGGYSTGCPR